MTTPAVPLAAYVRPPVWPLVLLVLLNLFNYIDRQVLAAVEGPIAAEFEMSATAMGSLVTGFLIVYMIFAPIFGWWADRYSKWKLIGVSMILQSLASGGSGVAGSFAMLMIMRCAVGVGEAAYGPAAPALLSEMYPVERRGKILAVFYAAIPVGSALGYAIGGGMRELTGDWRWAFYVLLPPGVLLGIICFFMKEPARVVSAHVPGATWRQYVDLFKIPSFTINSIGMTLMTFAIGGIAFWMPRYLEVDRLDVGISPAKATMIFGAISASAGLAATIIGGMVGDRLRKRFPGSYFHVSGVGMILGFPLFLLLLVTPFPYAWGVMFAAVFCLFLSTGPANTILANVVPAHVRSSAFALNIFVIHLLGDAISPPIIGAIANRAKTATSSGMSTGFVCVSILMAVGGVVWWFGARFLERDTARANAPIDSQRGFEVVPPVAP